MHGRIRHPCSEENGLMERCNRTIREALEDPPMDDWKTAQNTIRRVIRWNNYQRYHWALGYFRPLSFYLGKRKMLKEERKLSLVAARHLRKEMNLGLR